jgi:hypothetical protein
LAPKMQVGPRIPVGPVWEYSYKRLELAQLLGQLGDFLTCGAESGLNGGEIGFECFTARIGELGIRSHGPSLPGSARSISAWKRSRSTSRGRLERASCSRKSCFSAVNLDSRSYVWNASSEGKRPSLAHCMIRPSDMSCSFGVVALSWQTAGVTCCARLECVKSGVRQTIQLPAGPSIRE